LAQSAGHICPDSAGNATLAVAGLPASDDLDDLHAMNLPKCHTSPPQDWRDENVFSGGSMPLAIWLEGHGYPSPVWINTPGDSQGRPSLSERFKRRAARMNQFDAS
jgi:hypothetical protein